MKNEGPKKHISGRPEREKTQAVKGAVKDNITSSLSFPTLK